MDLNRIRSQIQTLNPLVQRLKICKNPQKKLEVLLSFPGVIQGAKKFSALHLELLPLNFQVVAYALFAIGQADQIFRSEREVKKHSSAFQQLLEKLDEIEIFYHSLGGIVGYHLTFLQLLLETEVPPHSKNQKFEKPPGLDISKNSEEVLRAVQKGVEALPSLAEIYPVAGAADRLNLFHPETKTPLPAAELYFLGATLLEILIRDLEAREYLYFKLNHKRLLTPIVLMTSSEKDNHSYIFSNLKNHNWFGRTSKRFYFIHQPLVPMICKDGFWAVGKPLEPIFKPGGHGIIWKLIKERGAFKWLKRWKRVGALVRQINNPIGGIDKTLSALIGKGMSEKKTFGFVSCDRIPQNSEGINILIETKVQGGYSYKISNLEYTDFKKRGIKDLPDKGSPFSPYPTNTNILFADLKSIEKAVLSNPFPGLLINMKSEVTTLSPEGSPHTIQAGRVESTMQNIADYFELKSSSPLTKKEKEKLPTFLIYNPRYKTIAVTKKRYTSGESIQETIEGSLFEILHNGHELLSQCGFTLPPLQKEQFFVKKGPSYLFTYHPALGPLYEIIQQKLLKGKIHLGAELKLDISELLIEELDLKGSLIIKADQITGHKNSKGRNLYSHQTGRCFLKNISVKNKGIQNLAGQDYSHYRIHREQSLHIHLKGASEFFAENISFRGSYNIIVPDKHRMIAEQNGQSVKFRLEKLRSPTWKWDYSWGKDGAIRLDFINL